MMDKRIKLAKNDLKKMNYWMLALMMTSLILAILAISGVLIVNVENERHVDFIQGYQSGLACSLLVLSTIKLIKNHFLAKNEEKLITKYINDHDERKLFIADKVGNNFSFTLQVITLALVSIIAPLYSFDFLVGIVCCIYIIAIIRGCLYLYYSKKY